MTRIAIAGAAGRMGKALVRCSTRFPDLKLAAALEQAGHPDLGKDAGGLAGVEALNVGLSADPDAVMGADVLIDFTFHAAVPANAARAARHGKAVVIGTTGLSADEAAAVRAAARSVPIVWAPNMSLGVNLLFALVRRAAALLGPEYDIEVLEMHHRHKKDAPSGTALKLAEMAAEGRGGTLESLACYARQGLTGERPAGQIGLQALRGGDVVGDHTVFFAAEGERLELSHRASNRDAFAMGALRAAGWVHGRQPGLYDMQDVLGLRD